MEQTRKKQIEEILVNFGFKNKDGKLCAPNDENGTSVIAHINDNVLEFKAKNKKRNIEVRSQTDLDMIKEDLPSLGSIEDAMEIGLGLDFTVKYIIESVIREVNDRIKCIDIECMEEMKFEDHTDFSNVDMDKTINAGNKLLNILKEKGAKDAYMSGMLATLLSDLPCYEAVKVDEVADSIIKPDRLVGSVAGVNVHIYTNLSWSDNTVYYE